VIFIDENGQAPGVMAEKDGYSRPTGWRVLNPASGVIGRCFARLLVSVGNRESMDGTVDWAAVGLTLALAAAIAAIAIAALWAFAGYANL